MTLYDGLKEIFDYDGYSNGFDNVVFFKLSTFEGLDLTFYGMNTDSIDFFKKLKLEYDDVLEYGKIYIVMDDSTWYEVEYQGVDILAHKVMPNVNMLKKENKQSTQQEVEFYITTIKERM